MNPGIYLSIEAALASISLSPRDSISLLCSLCVGRVSHDSIQAVESEQAQLVVQERRTRKGTSRYTQFKFKMQACGTHWHVILGAIQTNGNVIHEIERCESTPQRKVCHTHVSASAELKRMTLAGRV
jgi:hypothetical protein